MDECTCQTPGNRNTDFIEAFSPDKGGGWKLAWYARKDCPLHGMKEISMTDMPTPEDQPQ